MNRKHIAIIVVCLILSFSLGVLFNQSYRGSVYKEVENLPNIKLNFNNATKEDLMKVYGIGEEISERIIQIKNQNGKFESWEDVENSIYQLGPKKIEQLQEVFYIE